MNCQEKFLVLVHVPNARHAFGADQTLAMWYTVNTRLIRESCFADPWPARHTYLMHISNILHSIESSIYLQGCHCQVNHCVPSIFGLYTSNTNTSNKKTVRKSQRLSWRGNPKKPINHPSLQSRRQKDASLVMIVGRSRT
jgi:hypothetical protein